MKHSIDEMIKHLQEHNTTSKKLIMTNISKDWRNYEMESIEIRNEIIEILRAVKEEKKA